MVEKNRRIHGVWGNPWTFIFAATGSCVGLGAMWKFPYVVGAEGGGAFVLLYLLFLFVVGLPLLIAEVMIGRRARQSPINAMRYLNKETGRHPLWAGIGWLGVVTGLLILSYYSVVAGWSMQYMVDIAGGTLQGAGTKEAIEHFRQLLSEPGRMMLWQVIFILLTVSVVIRGVRRGLGYAVRWMLPLLVLLLLLLLIYSYQNGALTASYTFLFSLDFSSLTASGVLQALGLALFTLSIGVGAMMAYGAYIPDHAPVAKSLLLVVLFEVLVALVFAVVVFSVVFANPDVQLDSGPGLMFITMPLTFANMPGGLLLGALFFFLTVIAAWSSAIALMEPAVAWLVESVRCTRFLANFLVGLVVWLLGLGTIFSFNLWRDGINFYGWVDLLSSSILLPLTGLLIALFVGWMIRRSLVREEFHSEPVWWFNSWYLLLKYLSPVMIAIILGVGIYSLW